MRNAILAHFHLLTSGWTTRHLYRFGMALPSPNSTPYPQEKGENTKLIKNYSEIATLTICSHNLVGGGNCSPYTSSLKTGASE